MDDAEDLGLAVAGFRRAEMALAGIVADADRLVDARGEVEQARDELKVVAGALVGLASAHRDLVGQLGEAAAALHPAERRDEDRLVVALRDAEESRGRQVAEVADSVEELARRLDRALAERIGGVVAELLARLPSAEQVGAVADRLEGLASADRLAELAERLDGLPTSAQLGALADRLDQLDALATSAQLEKVADRLDHLDALATSTELEKVAGAVGGLARADQLASLAERLEQVGRADHQALTERLDAPDRLPWEQLAAIKDLLSVVPTTTDLARLGETATSAHLDAMELRLVGTLSYREATPPAVTSEEVAELAAAKVAEAVDDQVARLLDEVKVSQQRAQVLMLAVGVSFLIFAALVVVLALL